MNELKLITSSRTESRVLNNMKNHYSQPKGFVGRNIVYLIMYDDIYYGSIVGGSATKHLPGRNKYFDNMVWKTGIGYTLNNIVNNIFFHIEPINGKYPERNFSQKVLNMFQDKIKEDWFLRYGDKVFGFETLVELPRTGEIYIRNGFKLVGQTKGFTCKRVAGKGTDDWSGKRVWDTVNLRPKLVLVK